MHDTALTSLSRVADFKSVQSRIGLDSRRRYERHYIIDWSAP